MIRVTLKTAPKFKTKVIRDELIARRWAGFQEGVLNVGARTYRYMKKYINTNRKRRGQANNLAKNITFEAIRGTGRVGFRIGSIAILNTNAPYWYVLNYGVKYTGGRFIPGGGKWRPISFDGTPARKGITNQRADIWIPIVGNAKIPRVIRPLRYIDASILKFNIEYRKLLAELRTRLA